MTTGRRLLCIAAFGMVLQADLPAQTLDLGARVRAVRASAREELWRRIPFGRSLTEALEEAARLSKPVFQFAGDGYVDSGNC